MAESISGSRSTTASPTAATSPGSGTPTSSCSPTGSVGWSAPAPGPVPGVGAGAGAVSLEPAAAGEELIAVERAPGLAARLESSAAERALSVTAVVADLGSPAGLRLPSRPGLAIGPLHLIQELD